MIHGFSSEIYFQIKVWGGLYMKQSSIFIYKSWLVNMDGLNMRVAYPMNFLSKRKQHKPDRGLAVQKCFQTNKSAMQLWWIWRVGIRNEDSYKINFILIAKWFFPVVPFPGRYMAPYLIFLTRKVSPGGL